MKVALREVRDEDLPIFFEQQLDAEAQRLAAFPGRAREAFLTHWAKCRRNPASLHRTILADDQVAGNVVCWQDASERLVGYWLGHDYWGRGIASAALARFLTEVKGRPLRARVAKHNLASIRVLEKCGFRLAGEDAHPGADGAASGEFIMELSSEERAGWQARPQAPNHGVSECQAVAPSCCVAELGPSDTPLK